MKKNQISITLSLAAIIILCIDGCHKSNPPTVCYNTIADSAFVEQPVSFQSCTKGANSALWNFGDGTSASGDSTTHVYTTGGVYHGSLTISNGQSSTKNFTITVISNTAGYFTLNAETYFPAVCDSMYPSVMYAYLNADSFGGDYLSFGFNPSLPSSSGYYNISSSEFVGGVMPGQVDIDFRPAQSSIIYHASANSGKQVQATKLPGSHLNIVGINIEMVNVNAPYDSFPITFNITRTN